MQNFVITSYLFFSVPRAYPLFKAIDFSGNSEYRGVIIIHIKSRIETIAGLRGKKVVVVSRKAVSGYLAQTSLCVQNGINPEKDLTVILAKSQDEFISKVYHQIKYLRKQKRVVLLRPMILIKT